MPLLLLPVGVAATTTGAPGDYCYYPCHWFVDYGTCYYPWWICGGFGGYGYVAKPHVSIFIGW